MSTPKYAHYCSTAAMKMQSPTLENCFHVDTTSVTSIMAMVGHEDFKRTSAIDESKYDCTTDDALPDRATCARKQADVQVMASFPKGDAASDTELFFKFGSPRELSREACLRECDGRAVLTKDGDKDQCYCIPETSRTRDGDACVAKDDYGKVLGLVGNTCDPAKASCVQLLSADR